MPFTIQLKCANYWPDIFGQEVTYGDVTVLNICSDKYADYIVTVFNLESNVSSNSVNIAIVSHISS